MALKRETFSSLSSLFESGLAGPAKGSWRRGRPGRRARGPNNPQEVPDLLAQRERRASSSRRQVGEFTEATGPAASSAKKTDPFDRTRVESHQAILLEKEGGANEALARLA